MTIDIKKIKKYKTVELQSYFNKMIKLIKSNPYKKHSEFGVCSKILSSVTGELIARKNKLTK